MNNYHVSVLLQEIINILQIQTGKQYIDATLGGGGHTSEMLRLGGKVLAIDTDEDALDYVESKIKDQGLKIKDREDLYLVKGNFKDIDTIAKENGFNNVAGILFDLGISSHHVDDGSRGFSFLKEANLDMRMDRQLQVTAKDLINGLTKGELLELFNKLGEEPFANAIVRRIIDARKIKQIETTTELARIVTQSVPKFQHKVHPATRVFQALRIAVNDELNVLRVALPKALSLLETKGRLAVISFHSLEDRIIKQTFREWEERGCGIVLTKKPIVPGEAEMQQNTRSRSAKLRVFEKV